MPPGYLVSLRISLDKGRRGSVFLDNLEKDKGSTHTVSVGQNVRVRVFRVSRGPDTRS